MASNHLTTKSNERNLLSLKVTNLLLQLDTIFPSVFSFLQIQKQTKNVKSCEDNEILPYWWAKRSVFHSCKDTGRRQEISGSETIEFIAHIPAGSPPSYLHPFALFSSSHRSVSHKAFRWIFAQAIHLNHIWGIASSDKNRKTVCEQISKSSELQGIYYLSCLDILVRKWIYLLPWSKPYLYFPKPFSSQVFLKIWSKGFYRMYRNPMENYSPT